MYLQCFFAMSKHVPKKIAMYLLCGFAMFLPCQKNCSVFAIFFLQCFIAISKHVPKKMLCICSAGLLCLCYVKKIALQFCYVFCFAVSLCHVKTFALQFCYVFALQFCFVMSKHLLCSFAVSKHYVNCSIFGVAVPRISLQHIVTCIHDITLQYNTLHCITLHCSTLHCITCMHTCIYTHRVTWMHRYKQTCTHYMSYIH